MVIVCDSEDRENEGDLVMAAQFATPEAVNFMMVHGRGLICLALTAERCEQLGLQASVRQQRVAPRHGLHGGDRGEGGHHHGHLRAGPLAHDHGRRSTPARARTTW